MPRFKKIDKEELDRLERELREAEEATPDALMPPEEEPVITIKQPEPMPVPNTPPVDNNGHAADSSAILQQIQPTAEQIQQVEERKRQEIEDIRRFEEEESERSIPGHGYLVNVKPKHLAQSTRLNEREILLFAIAKAQDSVLDPNRTQSVASLIMQNIMENKISLNGLGREETLAARQQEAEKAAEAAAKGALLGR